ncbi:hypothetical protein Trydic_g18197 [Trypoxylus dichotomus]
MASCEEDVNIRLPFGSKAIETNVGVFGNVVPTQRRKISATGYVDASRRGVLAREYATNLENATDDEDDDCLGCVPSLSSDLVYVRSTYFTPVASHVP